MIIDVDLAADPPRFGLVDPEDCGRFHIAARNGSPEYDSTTLAGALADAGVGSLPETGEALVDIGWVRQEAAGHVPADWETSFAGMLAYAERKGWLDESKTLIRAHVEWA